MNTKDIIPTEVVKEVYSDGVSPALKEVGKFGKDIVKTIRLLTIPIQYTAHVQDRLEKYFEKISKEIPDEHKVVPPEPILIPILEKLKYHDPDDIKDELSKMYQELLRKSFDKTTTSIVHPSFIDIIGQLSPDEVNLFNQIADGYKYYNIVLVYDDYHNEGKLYIQDDSFIRIIENKDKKEMSFSDKKKQIIKNLDMISISFTDLLNSEYAQAYIEHLEKLGLIENYKQYPNDVKYTIRVKDKKSEHLFNKSKYSYLKNISVKSKAYRLTEFGKLFHNVVTFPRSQTAFGSV